MRKTTALAFFVSAFTLGITPTLAASDESATNVDAAAANAAPCIQWVSPLGKPRFALLCIHGLGLYSKSYQGFGTRLARHGAAVYAIDVRGFGSWMKAQGHQNIDFNACLKDIKTALDSIHSAHPGLPVFLLGESMGGAIALRAASLYPDSIDGLVSSVPAGDRFQNKRMDLKVGLEMLKGPRRDFDVGKKIIEQASSHVVVEGDKKVTRVDTQEVKDWESDPLCRMDLSPKDLMQFQKFMNDNYDSAKKVEKLPVLFVQGIDDRLVRPDGTWDLFKQLATKSRTMLALPSRHLIFEQSQDSNQELNTESTHMLLAWINSQMDRGGAETTVATAATALGTTQATTGGTISSTIPPALDSAIQKLNNGHFVAAQDELEQVVKAQPDSADAHYWLGIALVKNKRPLLARREFVLAMQAQKDAKHRQEANDYLLSMETEPGSKALDADLSALGSQRQQQPKRVSASAPPTDIGREIANGKPSVLLFYADWCQQCKQMDNIVTQGKQMFGQRIRFIKVDVTDAANANTIKNFSVGPIPTIVFLDKTGAVGSMLIGESNFVHVAKEVAGIVR